MNLLQDALAVGSGTLVGFSLGLVGGGGSILAVPLLVYVVGVASPHIAIGTSAVAVAASAAANLLGHARAKTVKWGCAASFAAAGIAGAAVGAHLGKLVPGEKLLTFFGLLMIVVGVAMLKPRKTAGDAEVKLTRASAARLLLPLLGIGFIVGLLSGFFGIGGGFLIVPGLMAATGMPLINAVGSSLMAVTAFGMTTALSYAVSGFVDWPLAAMFVLGGATGGGVGILLGRRLSHHKHALTLTFSTIVIGVGVYVVFRGLQGYA